MSINSSEELSPPPPPNQAQALVAKTGLSVYEPGRTLFDQPVLVFLAGPPATWPDFYIVDHLGREFGQTRETPERTWSALAPRMNVQDALGNSIMGSLRATSARHWTSRVQLLDAHDNSLLSMGHTPQGAVSRFDTHGLVHAQMDRNPKTGMLGVLIDGQPVGFIPNQTIGRSSQQPFVLQDHRSQPFARFFALEQHGVVNYVVGIDPRVPDPIRHLIPAMPTALALVRRIQDTIRGPKMFLPNT